jgi:hypothetical protein
MLGRSTVAASILDPCSFLQKSRRMSRTN